MTAAADWLPPESRPHRYYSRLVFAGSGTGTLGIVGRELQLVWYETQRDCDRERNGKLVSVLEFRDCRRSRGPLGERYYFTASLLEDMSGEYRAWASHQEHPGRPFGEDADVLETEVRFSVSVQEKTNGFLTDCAPATQPFIIHTPDVQDLSSPQLDMLFDAMNCLYRSIPGMILMEELRSEQTAEPEPPNPEREAPHDIGERPGTSPRLEPATTAGACV
jgi:hypothetical protein